MWPRLQTLGKAHVEPAVTGAAYTATSGSYLKQGLGEAEEEAKPTLHNQVPQLCSEGSNSGNLRQQHGPRPCGQLACQQQAHRRARQQRAALPEKSQRASDR